MYLIICTYSQASSLVSKLVICWQVLPSNVLSLPTKPDTIKPAFAAHHAALLPGRRDTDLGRWTSAAVDWKWRIKLLSVCQRIRTCARTLEAVVSHLNNYVTQRLHMMSFVWLKDDKVPVKCYRQPYYTSLSLGFQIVVWCLLSALLSIDICIELDRSSLGVNPCSWIMTFAL